jgi:hypothetical protein
MRFATGVTADKAATALGDAEKNPERRPLVLAAIAKSNDKRDILDMLRPYWIKTDKRMSLGYGITGRSKEDAETLLRLVFPSDCAIVTIEPLEDAAALDQGHVIPNMGNMLRRGIWYPLGYDHLTD